MYQTMSYENQLKMKETQIRELLENALIQGGQTDAEGRADFEWEGIHGSPIEFGYRNKMEFSLVMNIRMVRFLWACTRRAAPMIS